LPPLRYFRIHILDHSEHRAFHTVSFHYFCRDNSASNSLSRYSLQALACNSYVRHELCPTFPLPGGMPWDDKVRCSTYLPISINLCLLLYLSLTQNPSCLTPSDFRPGACLNVILLSLTTRIIPVISLRLPASCHTLFCPPVFCHISLCRIESRCMFLALRSNHTRRLPTRPARRSLNVCSNLLAPP
jgi:hypothetical protein